MSRFVIWLFAAIILGGLIVWYLIAKCGSYDWSEFGTFFGGTGGTAVALLALIYLVKTLDEMKAQAEAARSKGVYATCLRLLDSHVRLVGECRFGGAEGPEALSSLLAQQVVKKNDGRYSHPEDAWQLAWDHYRISIGRSLVALSKCVAQLNEDDRGLMVSEIRSMVPEAVRGMVVESDDREALAAARAIGLIEAHDQRDSDE